MPNPVVGLIGASVGSSVIAKKSAEDAAEMQAESADEGIRAQQRNFRAVQKLLAPYVGAGNEALIGQMDLLGLNGRDGQQQAIQELQTSPQFSNLIESGENAIVQNASATGGLRGGNTQAALGQFRPQLLSQMIEQQYAKLGGITSIGQNAAAGTGNASTNAANQTTQLLQQQGAALAGGSLAKGQAIQQGIGGIAQGVGMYYGNQQPPMSF